MKKPGRLKKGDTIAVITPSWGGPSLYPHIFESGLDNLRELGFTIVEMPNTRRDAKSVYAHPELRADDINSAFSDTSIHGIISAIGGSDSVRVLKYLDMDLISANPKFFMGYSDFTSLSSYLNVNGLVTFNGPSVMAGFSQFRSYPGNYQHFMEQYLFAPQDTIELPVFESYSEGYPAWGDEGNTGKIPKLKKSDGIHVIQGSVNARGRLYGGCIEVIEMLKGTAFWPKPDFWNGRILFLETSEEKPSIDYIKYWLRNFGAMEVFDKLSGLMFGRAMYYSDTEKAKLEDTILQIVRDEFGNDHLPVMTNCDFGHTDPQVILGLGLEYEMDVQAKRIVQLESAFA